MRRPIVVLSEDINPAGKKILSDKFEIVIPPDTSEEALLEWVPNAFGIILRATTRVTRKVIEHASKLKVIARTGVGVDNIDLTAAKERGIYVCITPGMNDVTVAEHTVALILALAKQIRLMDRATRAQQWNFRFSENQVEVNGKILGLVGLGAIGRQVAQKCASGLGMKIFAYDPFVQQQGTIAGVEVTFCDTLEELFQSADFISVHAPNLPETRGLVSKELLGMMKPNAFYINTARGQLVDEPALIHLLQQKKIAGAALDVFWDEPLPATSPLNSLENVVLTPHAAGSTWESNVRIAESAALAVLDVFEGREPKYYINK